ncbi:MAG: biotin--[acetyl-CoA-carboxylase] ligase [Anaerolineae bacterium]|nr:biotin--[acetyl-CoA-carboxylase] ligase [Anaerolineae bacterium]
MPQDSPSSQDWWQYPPWLQQVAERAKGLKVGGNLIYRRATASTNDDVRQLALKGAPEGLVVLADEQTHGRGRLGRPWLAPAESSLLLSVLFRHPLPMSETAQLTMLVGLAALESIEVTLGLRCALKWPNDVMLGDRKLGGILAETEAWGHRLRWAVVGLGLNVNVDFSSYPELQSVATSLREATGEEVDRGELLLALLRALSRRYAQLVDGASPVEEWQSRLCTLGRRVTVESSNERFSGTADFVTPEGSLFVRLDDGTRREVLAGDVKLRSQLE